MIYLPQSLEEIGTWVRNTIVFIPKKKDDEQIGGTDKRNLCACTSILLEMELREVEKRDTSWGDIHIFGFEERRSATEISTAIRLMAAAAREWCPVLGFITCSLDVKQAFDNVSQ